MGTSVDIPVETLNYECKSCTKRRLLAADSYNDCHTHACN